MKGNLLMSKKKKKVIIGCCIGGIIIILLLLALSQCSGWFDPGAKLGTYPGKSEQQIQNELDADIAEGEMNISIANTIKFKDGPTKPGVAHIENASINNKDQKVRIYFPDNPDRVIYQSGAIAPGYYVDTIMLTDTDIAPGQYKVIAAFDGYKRHTFLFDWWVIGSEYTGTVAAEVNLLVA